MATLTAAFDWTRTPLGAPDAWPVSLRSLVHMLLSSRFPMLLFWGPELSTFYNDAFRPSLGNDGKHPSSLGEPGHLAWAESWPTIGPLIRGILAGGPAVWFEDQKLPIYRNGRMEYAYWTYSFSPVADDSGRTAGILVTCSETTTAVESLAQLQEANRQLERSLERNNRLESARRAADAQFRHVANSSPTGLWLSDTEGGLSYLNDTLAEWTGLPYADLLGAGWANAIVPEDRAAAAATFAAAVARRGHYETVFRIRKPDGSTPWCRAAGDPFFNEDGSYGGYAGYCMDIDQLVRTQRDLEQQQQRLLGLFEQSPVAIAIITGEDLTFRMANPFYAELVGRKSPADIVGKPLLEALPEIEGQGFVELLHGVLGTGVPFVASEVPVTLVRANGPEIVYVELAYQPLRDPAGATSGVLVVATDVTGPVHARKQIEESETRFRTLIEEAPVATCLFVGRGLRVEVANEPMLQLWGKDRSVIGQPLADAVPELKGQPFLAILEDIFDAREPFSARNAPAQLEVDGRLQTFYFDFTYTPLFDSNGDVYAIMDTAVDVTAQVAARRELEASEARFRALIAEAPVATCLFEGRDLRIAVANESMLRFWGRDHSVIGKRFIEALPELEGQPFIGLLENVWDTGETFEAFSQETNIVVDGRLQTFYFDFSYKALRDADGAVYGIMSMAVDVTAQVLARRQLADSEARLRTILATAPVAIGMFIGPDLVIENANDTFIDFMGKGPGVEGKPLHVAMPELVGQPFLDVLHGVYETGVPYGVHGALVQIERQGIVHDEYYSINYTPVRNAAGEVYAILEVAIEMTAQVQAQQALAESALFAQNIIDDAPVAMLVLTGAEMRVRTINGNMLRMLGRDDSIAGQPFFDALPELREGPLPERLRRVFETGAPYYQPEEEIELMKDGAPYRGYYNYIYTALRNTQGAIWGVLVTATEVTDQVRARLRLEEAEAALRGAIDLAGLATWDIDLQTGRITGSERFQHWVGFGDEGMILNEDNRITAPADSERAAAAYAAALEDPAGRYDVEHGVLHRRSGEERILHARGQVLRNAEGIPTVLRGTALDITLQRALQTALEQQVQRRTEELAAAVEELRATNEELGATNDRLFRSNEELAQYAYVASHDLQEPLRKIQLFSDRLAQSRNVHPDDAHLLERVRKSAARMHLLIRDLLDFSRLVKTDEVATRPVDLNVVAAAVITDFELLIAEKGARVEAGDLPVVDAVPLQMNQLFYNLVGNALKFTDPERAPVIRISSEGADAATLTAQLGHAPAGVPYYHVQVRDNGIGFNPAYMDQVFEVFKRLVHRSEYSGSGIGLAICRRIVHNHHGAIWADSEPGVGTTFHVLLRGRA